MQTVNIVGPIVQAVQGLNNPSAAQIAVAVQNAIGNNPTAQAISGPIIAAIQALNNPTAAEIAQAIRRVLQGQPPAGLAPVGLFPPPSPAPSTPPPLPSTPAPSTPARNPLAPRTPRTPASPLPVPANIINQIKTDSVIQSGTYRIRPILRTMMRDKIANIPGQSMSSSNNLGTIIDEVLHGETSKNPQVKALVSTFTRAVASSIITAKTSKKKLEEFLKNQGV